MRLIDADALINDIEELITEHEEMMRDSEEHPENYPEDYKTRVLNLIAGLIAANVEVANASTIDAVPVKYGEWINTAWPDSDNIFCDQCGYDSIVRYDFCPSCGADMRGGKHEVD